MTRELVSASAQGIDGIATVRRMLAGNPDDADTALPERRARLVAFAAAAAPLQFTPVEQVLGSVRVLRMAPTAARGRVVYLHGGAYVLGSADTHARLAAAHATASGAEVLAVDYRLAPEHPYPAALDDAMRVWTALDHDAPVALLGDSAGGGLALALALRLRDERLPTPAALAVTSPWIDLSLSGASIDERADIELMLSRRGLELDATRYASDIDVRDPRVSPLFADLSGLPPTLIQVGTDEILYDDSLRLTARLEAAGVGVHLEEWQAMGHAWAAFGGAIPEAAESIARLGSFLRERLGA